MKLNPPAVSWINIGWKSGAGSPVRRAGANVRLGLDLDRVIYKRARTSRTAEANPRAISKIATSGSVTI